MINCLRIGCLALTDCEHVAPDKDKSDIFILQAEGRQFMLQAGSEAERDIWLMYVCCLSGAFLSLPESRFQWTVQSN